MAASVEMMAGPDRVTVAANTRNGDFVLHTADPPDALGLVTSLVLTGHEIRAVSRDGEVRALGTSTGDTTPTQFLTADLPAPTGSLTGTGDPLRSEQWPLQGIAFDDLWDCTAGGSGVSVAVLDTGVDGGHPDLAGRVEVGADCVTTPPQCVSTGKINGRADPHGHGTHVAGIIAAGRDNGVGVVGVAPASTVIPVRVLGADGSGDYDGVARGVTWAVEHGADMINLSLAGVCNSADNGCTNSALGAAISNAIEKGVVVVAAAGNVRAGTIDNGPFSHRDGYPATLPDVIAVGSFDPDRKVSSFSLRRPYVDVVAPGRNVLSTYPTGLTAGGVQPYAYMSGTSMAAPYVSGIVALMTARRPNISIDGIRSALLSSALPSSGTTGRTDERGCGAVDPVGAFMMADGRGVANGIVGCADQDDV